MPGRVIVARSLRSELRFHCPDDEAARHLAYVEATPDMPDLDLRPIEVRIARAGGVYYDFAPPFPSSPGTVGHMVERAHRLLRDQLALETEGAAILHGASLIVDERRCLVLAEKGSGKTTLVLEALRRGLSVETDEHIAVFPDHVLARPRTLRIKAGSLEFAEDLRDRITSSPMIRDWSGSEIYSFAPRTDSVHWRIRPGPADALVVLTPNHKGLTSVDRMGWQQAFSALLDNSFLPENGRGAALARLQRLAATIPCWHMRIGDLARAIWHLRQIANRV